MPKFGDGDTSFQAAGEEEGLRKLVGDFYAFMDKLPEAAVIRNMHPQDLSVSADKLTLFLCGWLGGPKKFKEKYGPIHIPRVHSHLAVDFSEEAAWLLCMQRALELQDYSAEFKKYFFEQIKVPAERIRLTSR